MLDVYSKHSTFNGETLSFEIFQYQQSKNPVKQLLQNELNNDPTWQSRFYRITGLHKIMIWTWFEFTIWFAFQLIIVGIWGGSEWTCKCCLFYVDFCRSMCSMFFIILIYWKCPQLIFSLQSSSTWWNPNPMNSNWLSISMFLACSNITKKKNWS
jgi:hypothetical protein